MWWLCVLSLAAAVVTAWPNAVVLIAAVSLLVVLCGLASWAMGRIGQLLQAPRLWFTAPLLAWWRPLVGARYRLRESRHRHSHYTSYC